MTKERKTIIGGLLNSIRIFNKMWHRTESEECLLVIFGEDDNITIEEAKEFLNIKD